MIESEFQPNHFKEKVNTVTFYVIIIRVIQTCDQCECLT